MPGSPAARSSSTATAVWRATVVARPCPTRANSRLSPIVVPDGSESVEDRIDGALAVAEGRTLLFGASAPDRVGATGHFNGKIEDPVLWAGPQALTVLTATVSDAPGDRSE